MRCSWAQSSEPYATTGVPTGTVTLTCDGYTLGSGTLSNGVATINLSDAGYPAGTWPVTATYSGANNNAPSSQTVNVTIQ